MTDRNQTTETINDIRNMMDRSSRFISLSGISGIAAGCCALVGAWFASKVLHGSYGRSFDNSSSIHYNTTGRSDIKLLHSFMGYRLFFIAGLTFICAVLFAFIFTYIRSRKQSIPIWGTSAKRLVWNVSLPLVVGGFFLLKLIEAGVYGLIAPGCLIFYGLALVNGAKFTIGEIRFLGYGILFLGIINCCFPGYGIYFWAAGFGLLHIIYGVIMWNKYERRA